MPPREWRDRVEDIIQAVERVLTYTQSMDSDAFARDQMMTDAVVRNLQVIGEASTHVPARTSAALRPHINQSPSPSY